MIQTTDRLLELADRYAAHNYHPLPVVLSRGEGAWVWDAEGRKYMDMLSAYSALNHGHRHPRIVNALIEQAGKLTLTSRAFHNDVFGPFCEKLCTMTGMDRVLLMNTGAEAVETAIKAARKWGYQVKGVPAGQAEIICCENNFHGRTITIVSFSTEDQYRDGFGPFTPGFKVIPYGDAAALERAITDRTVAFLVEPVQGEAGVVVPPDGYLRETREICRRRNVLFIADEIQTGLGRTGKLFACQHENVVPDIYIVGKALGGGVMPVSGILARDEVMAVFRPGDHGSTFGGNPLACAAGIAALAVLEEERLAERSEELGRWFLGELRRIPSSKVKEVRGRGLLIGAYIKEEAGTARPYCEALMEKGLLAKETHGQVIRFAPPLTITREELQWALERVSSVLVA